VIRFAFLALQSSLLSLQLFQDQKRRQGNCNYPVYRRAIRNNQELKRARRSVDNASNTLADRFYREGFSKQTPCSEVKLFQASFTGVICVVFGIVSEVTTLAESFQIFGFAIRWNMI